MKVVLLVTSSLSVLSELGFGFTQLIEDNETSKLAELEGISVASSYSEVMNDFDFENDPSENGSVSSDTSSS
jgi:hypothetical protein